MIDTGTDAFTFRQTTSRALFAPLLASILAFALPAQAARNEDQLMAQDRANKAVTETHPAAASAASASADPHRERPVLPLDHGPRASTTPWMNHLRMEHFNEESNAMAAKVK